MAYNDKKRDFNGIYGNYINEGHWGITSFLLTIGNYIDFYLRLLFNEPEKQEIMI